MEVEKDQHFLINREALNREIEEAGLNPEDKVIEIGAGTGILTEELAKKAGQVLSFEIDKKFKEKLYNLEKYNNLKIIYKNALNCSWEGYNKIVSNIPYSLSEPVVMKAINSNIELMVLIVSENFKNVLFSEDRKISKIANLFFIIKSVSVVKKESFFPMPKVDSWILKFERKKPAKIEKILQNIVTKNSKIKNAILYSLVENGKTKKQAKEIVNKFGLHENILNKSVKKITCKLIKRIKENLEISDIK